MTESALLLPAGFEYVATYLWATSGALLAARRGYAIMGILTIALVSATGGGLLRDGLFLQSGPPVLVLTPIYLQITALASLFVMLFGGRLARTHRFDHLVAVIDAIGLGAYAAVGMSRALLAGLPPTGVVLVGVVNAVGGGILRDLLLHRKVSMFQPGPIEEVLALVGCLLFLGLHLGVRLDQTSAAWIMVVIVFSLRLLALRFDLRSRPLVAFRPYQDEGE